MSGARRVGVFLPAILVVVLALLAGPAAASRTPGQRATDDLFLIVLIPAIGIGVLVQVLILYAVVKFRKRRGHTVPPAHPKTHDAKLEALWTVIPALILLIVGLATFQTLTITDTIPEDPDLVVTVTGQQFFWTFSVENRSGAVAPLSTNEFTVKVGEVVKLVITSQDVAHSFYIPGFGLKVDAIPGRENIYWFQAMTAGAFDIYCAELCGAGHAFMVGRLHVVSA